MDPYFLALVLIVVVIPLVVIALLWLFLARRKDAYGILLLLTLLTVFLPHKKEKKHE